MFNDPINNPSILQIVIVPLETRVHWSDGTVTMVKLEEGDAFSEESGMLYAMLKKFIPMSQILEAMKSGKKSLEFLGTPR
jgi:hypothetical protein